MSAGTGAAERVRAAAPALGPLSAARFVTVAEIELYHLSSRLCLHFCLTPEQALAALAAVIAGAAAGGAIDREPTSAAGPPRDPSFGEWQAARSEALERHERIASGRRSLPPGDRE